MCANKIKDYRLNANSQQFKYIPQTPTKTFSVLFQINNETNTRETWSKHALHSPRWTRREDLFESPLPSEIPSKPVDASKRRPTVTTYMSLWRVRGPRERLRLSNTRDLKTPLGILLSIRRGFVPSPMWMNTAGGFSRAPATNPFPTLSDTVALTATMPASPIISMVQRRSEICTNWRTTRAENIRPRSCGAKGKRRSFATKAQIY
mmetsp:Transcript_8660/g.21304  ORF Transcript_8660/g.21304 Transcript_8660/m.21304 type:complete len:206 (-) Transcript_8660:644-1261(-)